MAKMTNLRYLKNNRWRRVYEQDGQYFIKYKKAKITVDKDMCFSDEEQAILEKEQEVIKESVEAYMYGGYTFIPAGKLIKRKIEFGGTAALKLQNMNELGMWDVSAEKAYDLRPMVYYNRDQFYKNANNSDADIFICKETGKRYIPCDHELMEFKGYSYSSGKRKEGFTTIRF